MASLLERNKKKTTEALVRAAFQLFAQKGFDNTTVDEIAELAEVSRRTFFRYFSTKEAVVFHYRERYLEFFIGRLSHFSGSLHPMTAIRRACIEIAEDFMKHRQQFLLEIEIITSSSHLVAYDHKFDLNWENALVELFLEGKEDTVANRHRATVFAGAIFGVMRATIRVWFEQRCEPDLVEIGTASLDILTQEFVETTVTPEPTTDA